MHRRCLLAFSLSLSIHDYFIDKAKNPHTAIWQILMKQEFPKIILSTATPMFNRADDLLGLIGLLGSQSRDGESSPAGDPNDDDQPDASEHKALFARQVREPPHGSRRIQEVAWDAELGNLLSDIRLPADLNGKGHYGKDSNMHS
ncbi:hypothetical protein PENNAL_c0027G06726 [Penicillium nalgiovense]|uniref:SNF2 N-terminal domain-containing protein n=1 Tax=Penicillium nalgiovense TaxID=60175 RepID=A0A1V6Y9X5_PENNA|nr:hypothetical protein PENNAL_c0027G06726 [Penicillium nalgiovense]